MRSAWRSRPKWFAGSNLLGAKPCDDTPLRIEQAQRSGFHVEAGDRSQRRKKGALLLHSGLAGARSYGAFCETQGGALKRVAQQKLAATTRTCHAPGCRLQNNVRFALFFNCFDRLLVELFKLLKFDTSKT